jgi:hypothetical protein
MSFVLKERKRRKKGTIARTARGISCNKEQKGEVIAAQAKKKKLAPFFWVEGKRAARYCIDKVGLLICHFPIGGFLSAVV